MTHPANQLGRLSRLDLRLTWSSEATDFTPWLARAENLAILAETIGLDLELEAQERNVGPFRADLLCKSADDGHWVLIENQLERTDHGHLGQLLTYAAGLQAVTIVWVAARFTDEHRATLDWLNEITDESFRFFGLEVELWRIGDSLPAPKFNVVSKPNNWARDVGQAAKRIESEALTDTRQQQLKYWTMFRQRLIDTGSFVRPQKAHPQHWMDFSIGRSGFNLGATLVASERKVGVELTIKIGSAKAAFAMLRRQRDAIEAALGERLSWMELPERKSCRIILYREQVTPLDETEWHEIATWMQTRLERMRRVFEPLVRNLVVAADDDPTTHEELNGMAG